VWLRDNQSREYGEEEPVNWLHGSRCWLQVLVCALAAILLAGCSSQANETPVDLTPVRVLSARARLDEALRLAQEWREDAELKQIQASVIGLHQVDLLYVDFEFESPSEDYLKFAAMCSPGGCVGRESRVPYLIGYGSIEFDEEMIDSIEAARIGQQNGGERFMRMTDASIRVRLGTDYPRDVGPVVWRAHFSGWDGELDVYIDPYTGKVIRTGE
jgi:hypothetical protein